MKVEASLISEEDEGSGEGIVEALKKVVEVSKEVLKWVAELLEDEAEDREVEAVENCLPVWPHKAFGWRTVLEDSWTSHGGGSQERAALK